MEEKSLILSPLFALSWLISFGQLVMTIDDDAKDGNCGDDDELIT